MICSKRPSERPCAIFESQPRNQLLRTVPARSLRQDGDLCPQIVTGLKVSLRPAFLIHALIVSPHTSADDPKTYNPQSLDIFLDNLPAWRDGRPLPNRYDIVRGY